MKRWTAPALALMIPLAIMVLSGCEGDVGPQGPPGAATCTETCHTDSYDVANYIRATQAEYAASQHARAESVVRRSASCARCHTTEGFQQYLETGEAVEVAASSPIGCFACHAPHANENFALRTSGLASTSAVDLMVGGTYDKLESNLCVNCHQARTPNPGIEDLAAAITSSRWGTHHGPQSNILAGEGAWGFGASLDNNHGHNSISNGCVGCHMADAASSGLAGGHTFAMAFVYHGSTEINSKGCVGCHPTWDDGIATEEVEAHKATFASRLEALGDALVALGWMKSRTSVQGSGIPASADARGAVFNYQMLREDLSMGVHNPTYSEEVLASTEAYVAQQ